MLSLLGNFALEYQVINKSADSNLNLPSLTHRKVVKSFQSQIAIIT